MTRLTIITGDHPALRDYRLSALIREREGAVTSVNKGENIVYTGGSLFADEETIIISEKVLAPRVKEVERILEESPTTSFIISTEKMSSPLTKLCAAFDGEHESLSEKKAADSVRAFLSYVPLNLTAQARERVVEHVGESVDDVLPIVRVLSEVHPPEKQLNVEDVDPYLGERGLRLIWKLTDAIDAGDMQQALMVLNSVLKDSTPHSVVHLIQGHFKRMFYLYTVGVPDPLDESTGKEPYPVVKARRSMSRYGSYIPTCYELVSTAVMDMRGLSSIPNHLIIEILVSRLCSMKER